MFCGARHTARHHRATINLSHAGTALLVWQLWVALGILTSNVFNLLFYLHPHPIITLRLILGSPLVPAVMLVVSLYFTPESPRFYLRPERGNYKPEKAYHELRRLRNTELQALRDLYLVHRSVSLGDSDVIPDTPTGVRPPLSVRLNQYLSRYYDLFVNPRLRNSTISSGIVALGQQLCGGQFSSLSTTS